MVAKRGTDRSPTRTGPGISRLGSRVESFAEKGEKSFDSMIRHADNGDDKYQFMVGLGYLNGKHVKKSAKEAVRYFKLAVMYTYERYNIFIIFDISYLCINSFDSFFSCKTH